MDDGIIGSANESGYVRISMLLKEGYRNDEFFREDAKFTDRVYPINKRYNHKVPCNWNESGYRIEKTYIRLSNPVDRLQLLIDYNNKNCSKEAMDARENAIHAAFRDARERNMRTMLTRVNDKDKTIEQLKNRIAHLEHIPFLENEDHYNDGFKDGVDSIVDKLQKLIINL